MVTRRVMLLLTLASLTAAGQRDIQLDDGDNRTEKLVVGEKLRLRCNSEANIRWYKDGTTIQSSPPMRKITRQAVKFRSLQRTDAGTYGCHIKMENGTEQWRNITLMYDMNLHLDLLQDVAAAHVPGVIERREELPTFEDGYNKLDPQKRLNNAADSMLRANLTSMSLVNELEDSSYQATGLSHMAHFTKPERSHVVKSLGSTLQLRCPLQGNPELNITWAKDRDILNYDQWTLTMADVTVQDSGNYTCIICNLTGCINYTFKVDIIEPFSDNPYLREGYPHNVTTVVNSTVRFECPIYSDTESHIQWIKTSQLFADGTDPMEDNGTVIIQSSIPTETPGELVLSNVTHEDESWYTCIAGHTPRESYASTYLHVIDDYRHYKPILTEVPQNTTVMLNQNVSFHCEVLSDEPHVMWFQGHSTSHTNTKFRIYTDTPEVLVLRNVSYGDEGWYTCVAENSLGRTFASAYLRIINGNLTPMSQLNDQEEAHDTESNRLAGEYNETVPQSPPRFSRPGNMNRMVAKPAGNMLRLKCPAEGNPEPNITWTKDGAVPHRNLGTIRNGRWSLILEDLVVPDSGNYTCIVCNLCGCINFTFKVDIIERFPHKPYVKEGYPRNVTAVVNSTVRFECPTYSDLEPHIQWTKTPYLFEGETDPTEDNATVVIQSGIPTATPEVLVLSNVSYEDEGWYTCIAGNSLGVTYASAYLHVVDSKL